LHGTNVKILRIFNVMSNVLFSKRNAFVVLKTAETGFKLLITPWKRILLEKPLLSIESSGTLYPKRCHVPKT
jgi:hypothetical protein